MKFNIEILKTNLPKFLDPLQIEYFEEIDSTNTYLLKRKKFDNEILVITNFQTAGRGRFSRNWISNPNENLMFSIGLPSFRASDLSKLSFLTPLSIQESIEEFLDLNLSIKWPNDLIINNKKVCGILIESLIENNENAKVVVGIGINVNQNDFPDEIKERATSLRLIMNKVISRELLLAKIISKFFEYLILFPDNFELIYEKYKNKCTGLGKQISLLFNDKIYNGVLNDINKSGELELLIDNEKLTFNSGEITILKE
jgi:BirA family biotin operon repressor/biotin-[acetyl-CoA-carboxylase] ligase